MFNNNTKRSLQQILEGAQLRIPAVAVKSFLEALETVQSAMAELSKTKAAVITAEADLSRAVAAINETKDRAGLDLANGQITDAEAAKAIRGARDAEDLHQAKLSGLKHRAEALDADMVRLGESFLESKAQFALALKAGIHKRMSELAAPLAAALRQFIAVDGELRLGLDGLTKIRICDPEFTGHELDGCELSFLYQNPAFIATCEALAPFKQVTANVNELLRQAEADRIEAQLAAQRAKQLTLIAAGNRVYGTHAEQRGLSDSLIVESAA